MVACCRKKGRGDCAAGTADAAGAAGTAHPQPFFPAEGQVAAATGILARAGRVSHRAVARDRPLPETPQHRAPAAEAAPALGDLLPATRLSGDPQDLFGAPQGRCRAGGTRPPRGADGGDPRLFPTGRRLQAYPAARLSTAGCALQPRARPGAGVRAAGPRTDPHGAAPARAALPEAAGDRLAGLQSHLLRHPPVRGCARPAQGADLSAGAAGAQGRRRQPGPPAGAEHQHPPALHHDPALWANGHQHGFLAEDAHRRCATGQGIAATEGGHGHRWVAGHGAGDRLRQSGPAAVFRAPG